MSNDTILIDDCIQLQQLQLDAALELFALTDNNREYLQKWLPWVKATKTQADSAQFIADTLAARAKGSQFGYGIYWNGRLIGHMSLMHLHDIQNLPEIGYWIVEDAAGQGIMTKAVLALTAFGLRNLQLSEIVIHAHPNNLASNRVAEKAGYQSKGNIYDKRVKDTLTVWSITKRKQ